MTYLSPAIFNERLADLENFIRGLVQMESPSTYKPAVDRLGQFLAEKYKALGATIQVFPHAQAGDTLLARWGQGPAGILLLCHMDTVFDVGTINRNPFRQASGRIMGPGVLDMKSGIAMVAEIMEVFHLQGIWPARPITLLLTPDEETGSLTSRGIIEEQAKQAAIVFCLEPALPNGALKTARKGTGGIELTVTGRAAHAGVDHEKGRNAIEEISHHILSAQRLTRYSEGTTVNVGWVQGGTRANVVPEEARALIDFRITSMGGLAPIEQWARALRPVIEGTRVKAELTLNRPPMPRDAIMADAFNKAREIAAGLGLPLTEGSTGGGSDANFVAPLGIPVLDGLGPAGEGAHSEREFVNESSLVEQCALLAALLLNW